MTASKAEASRRSCASTPDADEMGIKRETGHFSSLIKSTPVRSPAEAKHRLTSHASRGRPTAGWPSGAFRLNLSKQSRYSPSLLWMHRQHVDDVGPIVAMSVAVAEQLRGDCVPVGSRTLEQFAQTAKVTEHAPRGRDTSRNSLVPLGASESPRLALGPAVSVPRYLAPTTGRGKRDLWHEKWSQATSRPAWFPRGTSALGSPRFPAGTGSWLSHPYPQVLRVALRL